MTCIRTAPAPKANPRHIAEAESRYLHNAMAVVAKSKRVAVFLALPVRGAEAERDLFINVYVPSLKARAAKAGVTLDVVDCKRAPSAAASFNGGSTSLTAVALSNIEDLSDLTSSRKHCDLLANVLTRIDRCHFFVAFCGKEYGAPPSMVARYTAAEVDGCEWLQTLAPSCSELELELRHGRINATMRLIDASSTAAGAAAAAAHGVRLRPAAFFFAEPDRSASDRPKSARDTAAANAGHQAALQRLCEAAVPMGTKTYSNPAEAALLCAQQCAEWLDKLMPGTSAAADELGTVWGMDAEDRENTAHNAAFEVHGAVQCPVVLARTIPAATPAASPADKQQTAARAIGMSSSTTRAAGGGAGSDAASARDPLTAPPEAAGGDGSAAAVPGSKPICVVAGDVGAGKSFWLGTFVAQQAKAAAAAGHELDHTPQPLIVSHCIGCTPSSSHPGEILRRLITLLDGTSGFIDTLPPRDEVAALKAIFQSSIQTAILRQAQQHSTLRKSTVGTYASSSGAQVASSKSVGGVVVVVIDGLERLLDPGTLSGSKGNGEGEGEGTGRNKDHGSGDSLLTWLPDPDTLPQEARFLVSAQLGSVAYKQLAARSDVDVWTLPRLHMQVQRNLCKMLLKRAGKELEEKQLSRLLCGESYAQTGHAGGDANGSTVYIVKDAGIAKVNGVYRAAPPSPSAQQQQQHREFLRHDVYVHADHSDFVLDWVVCTTDNEGTAHRHGHGWGIKSVASGEVFYRCVDLTTSGPPATGWHAVTAASNPSPLVRCQSPPTHSPLFLRLAVEELVAFGHEAFRDAKIQQIASCGSHAAVLLLRLQRLEKHCDTLMPGVVAAILARVGNTAEGETLAALRAVAIRAHRTSTSADGVRVDQSGAVMQQWDPFSTVFAALDDAILSVCEGKSVNAPVRFKLANIHVAEAVFARYNARLPDRYYVA